MYKTIIIFIAVVFLLGCVAYQPQKLPYPQHIPASAYNFKENNYKEEKINLGRFLFYDPNLSADGTISCASCHSPYNAFAHTDHNLSHGIKDQIGRRNAPALFNLAWHSSFMWDGAIQHLDMQALAPIEDEREMDSDISQVVAKLQKSPIYPELFRLAYGSNEISSERILKALAVFQLSLTSFDSKYDQVKQQKAIFTEQEEKGYQLFLTHCNTCHTEPLFTNLDFANNGLPLDTTLRDYGKGAITLQAKDSFLFKIPSLRNLSYTYPYMHDGRFSKLSQVLTHYQKGVQKTTNLHPNLANGLPLTANEKVDIIAFLLTLDDAKFVFNPKHQFPKELINN